MKVCAVAKSDVGLRTTGDGVARANVKNVIVPYSKKTTAHGNT